MLKSRLQPGLSSCPLWTWSAGNSGRTAWPKRFAHLYDAADCFFRPVRQLFCPAYEAFAESLASENASRWQPCNRRGKYHDRLADLRLSFNQMRQTAITEELLDIIAGHEALSRKDLLQRSATSKNNRLS